MKIVNGRYSATNLIQSVHDPKRRRLELMEIATGKIVSFDLPEIGPEIFELGEQMFDCWGNEIQISDNIDEIMFDAGIARVDGVDVMRQIYLVKKTNGKFAFARPVYDIASYNFRSCNVSSLATLILNRPEIKSVALTCFKPEFVRVEPFFFENTPLGYGFAAMGMELWFAEYGGGAATLIGFPYEPMCAHIWENESLPNWAPRDPDRQDYFDLHSVMQDCKISDARDRIEATFLAHPAGVSDESVKHLVRAELTADLLETARKRREAAEDEFTKDVYRMPFHLLEVLDKHPN